MVRRRCALLRAGGVNGVRPLLRRQGVVTHRARMYEAVTGYHDSGPTDLYCLNGMSLAFVGYRPASAA